MEIVFLGSAVIVLSLVVISHIKLLSDLQNRMRVQKDVTTRLIEKLNMTKEETEEFFSALYKKYEAEK